MLVSGPSGEKVDSGTRAPAAAAEKVKKTIKIYRKIKD
jgi:hypothetical protein